MSGRDEPFSTDEMTALDDDVAYYLKKINFDVFGEKEVQKTLQAILTLGCRADRHHLTKTDIAQESGVSTGTMYDHDILEVISDFGVVYLIDKVNREGAYVIPEQKLCQLFFTGDDYSMTSQHLRSFPELHSLIGAFGRRLRKAQNTPVSRTDYPHPLAVKMAFMANELGVGQPVSVEIQTEGSRSPDESNWAYKIAGVVEGDLAGVNNSLIEGWLKQK